MEGQEWAIQKAISDWEGDKGYAFGIVLKIDDTLIGRVNLSNITRGAWENSTIGYFIDQQMQGKGYMTDAVQLVLAFAFQEIRLHRVEAGVMPRNRGSIRVLEKVGFHQNCRHSFPWDVQIDIFYFFNFL